MLITFAVLCFFALVQSIYGVGLLIFGTPFLLLSNTGFDHALGILLPSSFLISLHQVFLYRKLEIHEAQSIFPVFFGLPLGLILVLQLEHDFKIMPVIGLVMLVAAFVRVSDGASRSLANILSKNKGLFHFCNAFVHGVSNLGGALLPVYSASVYSDKIRTLKCTSTFYSLYSGAQILLLIFMQKSEVFFDGLIFMPICLSCYFLGSKYMPMVVTQKLFDKLAIAFFWCIGTVLLFRSFAHQISP